MNTPALARQLGEWRTVGSTRDQVGECPVWDVAAQALYWIDIEGRVLRRWDASTGTVHSWPTAERLGCIALSERGTLVAAMETGIFELELAAAPALRARRLAAARHPQPGMRFNDGRCDAQGRLWVSTMCMDMGLAAAAGALQVLDEAGLSAPRVDGLITPNGLAFSGDGRTAWLSDSHPKVQQVWAFDFDVHSGALSGRRSFVDMRGLPGRPDGAAVDEHDRYWICANDAGLIHCFGPAGELLQSLAVPLPKPSMCCFGGPMLNTLFVTSIQPVPPSSTQGLSGALLACELSVRGRAEPRFSRFPRPAASVPDVPSPMLAGDTP